MRSRKANGNRSKLFPQWAIFFAPIGIVGMWWGWGRLQSKTAPPIGAVIYIACGFLWMYGFACFLLWIQES
jgi:hypothetical protein